MVGRCAASRGAQRFYRPIPKFEHVALNDEFGVALSWLSTFCQTGESEAIPMCSTGSVGHWLWSVMLVTFGPLRNAFV